MNALRQARALTKDADMPRILRKDFVLGRLVPPPKIEGGGSFGFPVATIPLGKKETRELVEYLRRTVSPKSWKDDPEVSIEHWDNRMTVRQTAEVLAAIGRELNRLGIVNTAYPWSTRPFVN